MMELNGPDVIRVDRLDRPETLPGLQTPALHEEVIAARGEDRLGRVEVDTTNSTYTRQINVTDIRVLESTFVSIVDLLDQEPQAVIPELDLARMKRAEQPGACRVVSQSLDSVAFSFKLSPHFTCLDIFLIIGVTIA